jgi:hypothetical protein
MYLSNILDSPSCTFAVQSLPVDKQKLLKSLTSQPDKNPNKEIPSQIRFIMTVLKFPLNLTRTFQPSAGTLPAFVKTSAFKAKTHANPDPSLRSGQAPTAPN